jgi:hypothetical protein
MRGGGGPGAGGARTYDVRDHGAVGDGFADDTGAIQKAVDDCAAAGGGRVVLAGARTYRTGTVYLRARVELHLEEHAVIQASLDPGHYAEPVLIVADGLREVSVTGAGRIDGRSQDFMAAWDDAAGLGRWIYTPAAWRPKMFEFRACTEVRVEGITFGNAPQWGLHLWGCEHVLVQGLTVRNDLSVPNCDGVGIDRCRDIEVRDCRLWTGDDSVVVKATANPPGRDFGATRGVHVHDCELTTQDSALKIGTETTADIEDVLFERCTVHSCNRACSVMLRDRGSVRAITFRDITFSSRHFSEPWWGHGEGISVTAVPRRRGAAVGRVTDVRFERIRGHSENSVRIDGSPDSRPRRIELRDVHVTLTKWTSFPGGVYDNRPTEALPALQPHDCPGFHLSAADEVTVRDCSVTWGPRPPRYYAHALRAEDVTGLRLERFAGSAAHPDMPAIRGPG